MFDAIYSSLVIWCSARNLSNFTLDYPIQTDWKKKIKLIFKKKNILNNNKHNLLCNIKNIIILLINNG